MRRQLCMLLSVCCLGAALAAPASALECVSTSSVSFAPPQAAERTHSAALPFPTKSYDFAGALFAAPENYLFGTPTSDNTTYVTTEEPVNRDRSKAAAYIPPAFGSPTSYTLNAGELLTPNLVQQATAGAVTNTGAGGVTVMPPSYMDTAGGSSVTGDRYTEVTDDLYYSGGHLGTLKIPAIGVSVKVYQGTDSAALRKGAGHFEDTSIWGGNVAVAAHNRGVNNHFGKIHTLDVGDTITWTTKLGSRSYEVYSVAKIAVDDMSVLESSGEDIITLVTCVMEQPDYRWCVQAAAGNQISP